MVKKLLFEKVLLFLYVPGLPHDERDPLSKL